MKETVSIVKRGDRSVEEAVREAVGLAGGLEDLIRPGSRVLIKPNLFKPAASGTGLVTDCRVTEAVARIVLEMGPKSVIIGEGSAAGYDFIGSHSTEESFRLSGTLDVAERLGVEWRNLNCDEFEEVEVPRPFVMQRMRIARTALESDVILSVPVLKSHQRTLVTLSLKNMKGVLLGAEKRKAHALGLDKAIADLNSVVPPSYTVVDALAGMEGTWEYPRDRRVTGMILAGRDPAAVDAVGTSLMGFDPAQVMHLNYFSMKRSGFPVRLESIRVVGEPLDGSRVRFTRAFEVVQSRYPGVQIFEGEAACTGCTGELIGALSAVTHAGSGDALNGVTVLLGNPDRELLPEQDGRGAESGGGRERFGTVVLGKCSRGLAPRGLFVPGCPPRDDAIIRALSRVCHFDAGPVIEDRDGERRRNWSETEDLLNS
ncbi:MAG TPA: DUF362 domain-containing protein [Spirochaetia bacterium]|nr:DUF362 domain-containing protein [Spirochaetia bacterium]